jgi:hypothetical protein
MDLSQYYRYLTNTISKPNNLSYIEEQIWDCALLDQSNVTLELINDWNVDAVKKKLTYLGLIRIKINRKIIHANVPGGNKCIHVVEAHFPEIENLNCTHPLFAAYLKALKRAIYKAGNLNLIEKVCCEKLNNVYYRIKNTTNKWITTSHNNKTWEII